MDPKTKPPARNEHRAELWEVFVTYIGIILTLLSLLLFALGALLDNHHPALANFMTETAKATLPIGVIGLIFERILRKHYSAALRSVIREEVEFRLPKLTQDAVSGAFEARQALLSANSKIVSDLTRFALARVMTRQEMEVSDICFRRAVEALAASNRNREFLIVGKTLSFTSKQRETLRYGLENGVCFQLCLIDPVLLSRETEAQRRTRVKGEESLQRLRTFVLSDRKTWHGSIEVRRMRRQIDTAFSSFVKGRERVSVLDLDLGDDAALQCSQVYIHDVSDTLSFGTHLYEAYLDMWYEGEVVVDFPARHRYAYIYARRGKDLIWIRKTDLETWELPGGKIEPGEVADETALREFQEETGLALSIETVFQTAEKDKIAFVGRASEGEFALRDPAIAEIREFPLDHEWNARDLTYPQTDYARYIGIINHLGL